MIMDIDFADLIDFKEPLEILSNRLKHWLLVTIDYLPSVVVAILVFILFFIISKGCVKLFYRYIGSRMESGFIGLYAFFIQVVVLLFGLYCAIEIMDFKEVVVSLLAGAGILGLVLGLAFQELITNLISGATLTIKKNFHVGDQISIKNHSGKVEVLGLRAATLRGENGETIIIPNKDVLQSVVTNYYTLGKMKKLLLIGIDCSEDVGRVIDVLKEATSSVSFLYKGEQTEVSLIGIEGEIMKLVLGYWVPRPNPGIRDNQEDDAVILSIKTAFDKNQMALPAYIRIRKVKKPYVLIAH